MELFNRGKLKLSTKVALSFIILVILQGTVSLITLSLIISRSQYDSFQTQMKRAVLGIEGYLQEILDEQTIKANLLAGQTKIIDYTDFGLKNLLQRELAVFRSSMQMNSLTVYRETGTVLTSVGAELILTRDLENQLKRAFEGENTFFVTPGVHDISLSVFNPIKRNDTIIGVLRLSRSLNRDFIQMLETFTNTKIILKFEGRTVTAGDLNPQTVEKIVGSPENFFESDGTVSVDNFILGAVSPSIFGETAGKIFCLLDTTEHKRLIARYNVISLISTFLILSIALLIAIIFYRLTFYRHFQRLLTGVYKISEGDLHYHFRVQSDDEFGDLAKAFNKMRINLLNREKELLQLSLYNTLILENVRTGIITFDLEKHITTFNPAATRILGLDPQGLKGRIIGSGSRPTAFFRVIEKNLGKDSHDGGREVVLGGKDSEKILSLSTSPLLSKDGEKIGMIAIFEDITRVKQLEEKLTISSRLAALGEMAAGVAHQIRNPLGVMKVSTEMLRDDFKVIGDRTNYNRITHMMVNEIDTLNLVIRNLLDFARPREIQTSLCSIRKVIDCSLGSLPLDMYPDLTIETDCPEDIPDYMMDKSLIEQVISNLILNAIQASGHDGKIRIGVSVINGRLQIEIQDWGAGFDEETRRQIFNPFFTTKPSGTGLGLSIGHRIIEKHNGSIDVFSEPGKGSRFRITL